MIVSKYHGCGNDFIITRQEEICETYEILAKRLCDRHCGIGADGFIVVKQHPLEMVFYNCDGSRAPMCGNGIRCFAHYVMEEGICEENQFDVETLAGVMHVDILTKEPFVVKIKMGKANFDSDVLHIKDNKKIWDYNLVIDQESYQIDTCFMGTIHTMHLVEDALDVKWEKIGKSIHEHPLFEERTNVNFVQIIDRHTIKVRTFERGVGMTKACGTGCCASVWDAWKHGLVEQRVRVLLECGYLDIEIDDDEIIYMSGPSQLIMKGAQAL